MKKSVFLILLILSLFILSACTPPLPVNDIPSHSSANAQFHFIDVGQGDCIFISDGKTNILIDSGTAESGGKVYNYLKELKVKKIDIFIGTHPHEDHLGGASAVISSIDTAKVFLNADTSNSFFYENFLDTLYEKDITPVIPSTECIYESGAFRLKFLTGDTDFYDTNDNSLVTMVQYGDIKALFTGDCEKNVETYLLENGVNLDADILKVGHHGSRYASSATFLKAVSPSIAVIQSEEGNSYGHPHDEAIKRLKDADIAIMRNDKSGDIILTTDGNNIYDDDGNTYEKIKSQPITLGYIGNKKSRIFHSETCPNLPSENNSIPFLSREDAINSGYKPCGNCHP